MMTDDQERLGEERMKLWVELLDLNIQLLLAGFRQRLGPDADIQAAFRDWYAAWSAEHDRYLEHLLLELDRRTWEYGGPCNDS